MEIPNKIQSILNRINQSEERWKAIYVGCWGLANHLKDNFKNTNKWNENIGINLPASKKGYSVYITKELHSILTSKDEEITFTHLQTLFSLFEELTKKSSEVLCNKKLNTSKWKFMEKFFEDNKYIFSDSQIKELKLAKETRNCYIHNNGKIDDRWLNSYKEARGDSSVLINDSLMKGLGGFKKSFHQIEEWQDLIIGISNKIKSKIESK